MSDSLSPQSPDPDEPDFQQMLSNLLGGAADNPQLAEALKAMGVDRLDPAAMGMISAQLKAMLSASPDEPFNAELATDVARKTVSAAGDASVGDAARRDVEEAAHVAGLWLDDVTQFTAPGVAARAWSRAEWVDQTMPVWRTAIDCSGTHSVTSMRSISRSGPTFVRHSNDVPTPSVVADVKRIDSASAIHSTWAAMSASASHTVSTSARTRRRTVMDRTR